MITFVGGKTFSFAGTTTAQTISLSGLAGGSDTSPSADDVVFLYYGVGAVANRSVSITTSGYASTTPVYINNTRGVNFVAGYKVMGGTPDANVTVSTGTATDAGAGVILVFRGVGATTLDVTTVTATSNTSVLVNPPPITPVTPGAWVIAGGAGGHGRTGTPTYSSSDLTGFLTIASDDTYDVVVGAGYHEWVSGAFDAAQFSWGAADGTAFSWAAATFALRPVALPIEIAVPSADIAIAALAPAVSSGASAIVPAANVGIAALAATVASGASVSVPAAAVAIAGQTPTVSSGVALAAPAANLALAAVAPSVAAGASVSVPAASVVIAGLAPAVSGGASLAVPSVGIGVAAQQPSVASGVNVGVPAANVSIAGATPGVITGRALVVPVADIAVSAHAPAVASGVNVSVPAASVNVAAVAPAISTGAVILAPAVNISLSGIAPTVTIDVSGVTILAPAANVNIAGHAPTVTAHSDEEPLIIDVDGKARDRGRREFEERQDKWRDDLRQIIERAFEDRAQVSADTPLPKTEKRAIAREILALPDVSRLQISLSEMMRQIEDYQRAIRAEQAFRDEQDAIAALMLAA